MKLTQRITYDLEGPGELRPGLVLRTKRGKLRLVVQARRVRSKHPSRWALEVVPIQGADVDCECRGWGCADGACPVLSLRWKPRKARA